MNAYLAADDDMLARKEEGFRLWESAAPFVVLGRSSSEDVLPGCELPVLRRSTGGGAVVQGPGCLNFVFVLSMERRPELRDVGLSYGLILGTISRTLELEVSGSDLLLDGRKVSGSAQRRSRAWLLHHGTVLYEPFDLGLVSRVLREPSRRPAYRGERTHGEFLGRLPMGREELVRRLAAGGFGPQRLDEVHQVPKFV